MTSQRTHEELVASVSALQELMHMLMLDNEQLRTKLTQLEQRAVPPSPEWIALNAADRGTYSYECVRAWCENGLIEARREGRRWFVNKASLSARLARLKAA
jgi:hypothetical protein